MSKSNTELVLENLAGFDRLDYEFVANGYAEDAVLHFMQEEPIHGRANILEFFERQFAPINTTRIEIVNAIESGDLVMVERIDHYEWKGIPVSCPVANATEVEDGKITVWREYYDKQYAADQVIAQAKARADAKGSA